MSTLEDQIKNLIQTVVQNYTQKIADQYDIDIQELTDIWKDVSGTTVPKPRNFVTKKSSGSTDGEDGCPYKFIKGGREGELCGAKPKDGCTYCGRHSKHEGTVQKPKKSVPTIGSKVSVKKKPKISTKVLPFKRHPSMKDIIWNMTTGFYIKSKEEQVVVGKIVDGELIPLTEEDAEVCNSYDVPFEIPESNDDSSEEPLESESEDEELSKIVPVRSDKKFSLKNTPKLTTKKALPSTPIDEDDDEDDGEVKKPKLKSLKNITKCASKAFGDVSVEETLEEVQEQEDQFDIVDNDDDNEGDD